MFLFDQCGLAISNAYHKIRHIFAAFSCPCSMLNTCLRSNVWKYRRDFIAAAKRDVTWEPWCLKSLAHVLFIQKFVHALWNVGTIYYPFVKGILRWRSDFRHTLQWRHNGRDSVSITSLTIVYSIVYPDADQRKHQSSASLAFVRGIHRGPVNSPHKWPVTRKMFPFDDVIMK